ncbi:MAG: HAMP domain-containing histidine kinase [Lautropia mirabilis]|nr:HAMP domain-containing histidine kinase [Lautropia mirabilis]
MRIDRIVEDVLSMARRGALSEVLDLRHFMAQFMPEFLANVKAGGAVVAGRDGGERIALRHDGHAPITFDPNHLRQILVNLLSNGLRHASDREGAVLLLWTQSAAGVLQLWVLDDGPGIPEDRREHLFEPFFTTETRGTGLGLHLTQELCTANGATIRYESSALLGEDIRQRYGAGFVITPQQRQVAEAGPVAAPSRMESDE